MQNSFNRIKDFYRKYPGVCFWTLVVLSILPVSLIKVHDIDIWWHMQSGRSVFELFSWPDFSQYYFTPVKQSVSSLRTTWLGDILFHLIYAASGDIGLQFVRLFAVLTACFLVRSQVGNQYKGWHLLLLVLLIVGTYQKQLIRNSLFALFLVPLILWIWHQIRVMGKIKYLWFYPVILGVWSCLHGSYLLGFGLLVLLFTGDTLDILRGVTTGTKRLVVKYIVVITLSFIAISLWNPTTQKYYSVSRLIKIITPVHTNEQLETDEQNQTDSGNKIQRSDEQDINIGIAVLRGLNRMIFDTSKQTNVSGDFVSPFDRLDRPFVWVALFSGLVGLFVIGFMARPVRFSIIIPYFGVLLAGMGYVRFCGYIPLVTAAFIFHAAGNSEIRPILSITWFSKLNWLIVMVGICLIWSSGLYHYPFAIGTRLHDFGLGRIPTYSNKVPDAVLKEFKNHKVFNTMSSGGYLLYRWFPEKKVFVDGFFAPHQPLVLEHLYSLGRKGTNPDFLYDEYGIDVAIAEHTRGSVLMTFFNSENWYVKYMDTGMVCFVYKPDFQSNIELPEILINPDEMERFIFTFKKHIAASLHTVPNTLYQKGRIKDANDFSVKYEMFLKNTEKLIDPDFITMTHQLKNDSEAAYGQINTKAQYHEYQQYVAIEAEEYKKVIDSGLKVIEINPERLTIAMNVAMAYSRIGMYGKSRQLFEKIVKSAEKTQPRFITDHKKNISKMYLLLSSTAKQNKEYIDSYQYAQEANIIDNQLFSDTKLYKTGMDIINDLNNLDQKDLALMLLGLMEKKFVSSGFWLNDMAWQLVITNPDYLNLEKAREYAQMAVGIFKKNQANILDLAYDTLAEIAFRQGDYQNACQYIKTALKAAPDQRKKNYTKRFNCD